MIFHLWIQLRKGLGVSGMIYYKTFELKKLHRLTLQAELAITYMQSTRLNA